MAMRLTTKMAKLVADGHSVRDILANGRFYGYSNSQPADADNEPNGVNCVIYTLDGNAFTDSTRANATLTPVGAGTLDTLKVGGGDENLLGAAVTLTGVLATDTAAIAAAINATKNSFGVVAMDTGTVVELYLPHHVGADGNNLSAAITQTGSTCTVDAVFSGGVDAVNGLNFDFPSVAGVLSKPTGVNWQGLGLANLNIGWLRFVAGGSSVTGDGADNVRFDCSVATSGGDLTASSLVITLDVLQSIGGLTLTVPRTES